MSTACPIQYEYIDGEKILSSLAGRSIPIPPEWVRQRVENPDFYKMACLSKEIEHLYPKSVRDVLVSYVWDFPELCRRGTNLIIAGPTPYRKRRWAAAAVVNELTMRWSQRMPISIETLHVRQGFPAQMDLRKTNCTRLGAKGVGRREKRHTCLQPVWVGGASSR